jgi:hypothetical protein
MLKKIEKGCMQKTQWAMLDHSRTECSCYPIASVQWVYSVSCWLVHLNALTSIGEEGFLTADTFASLQPQGVPVSSVSRGKLVLCTPSEPSSGSISYREEQCCFSLLLNPSIESTGRHGGGDYKQSMVGFDSSNNHFLLSHHDYN